MLKRLSNVMATVLGTAAGSRTPRRTPRRTVLGIESLHERIVPATINLPEIPPIEYQPATGVTLVNGDIHIVGSNGADRVRVSLLDTRPNDTYVVELNNRTYWFSVPTVTGGDIVFSGFAGDDRFENNINLRVTANGMSGNDTIISNNLSDDLLIGSSGEDYLEAGSGNDTLWAGNQYQAIDDSTNILHGMGGNDVLWGGSLRDELYGERGNDVMYGYAGNDLLDGGPGYDYLFGQEGNDTLLGGTDTDGNYMDGGAGNDVLTGSEGADRMIGGDGADTLDGKGGNDDLDGGVDGSNDILLGGAGKDRFRVDPSGGATNRDFPLDFFSADDQFYIV